MMTGYGDVLESTNQQQQQNGVVIVSASADGVGGANSTKTAPVVTISTSVQSHSRPHAITSPRSSNPYASFHPINVATTAVPPFTKLDPPTLQTCDVDSPRSSVSKISLPESNSEVVLGALRTLLDKLKDLEQERDRARNEIEKLDKNRQWAAFSCPSDSRSVEKPMTYEAACNTSEKDWNYNLSDSSFPNRNPEKDSRYLFRDSTIPFTPAHLSQSQNFPYPGISANYPYTQNNSSSSISAYQQTTSDYGYNPNMVSRSTTNYPVLTSGSRSGSLCSTGLANAKFQNKN